MRREGSELVEANEFREEREAVCTSDREALGIKEEGFLSSHVGKS